MFIACINPELEMAVKIQTNSEIILRIGWVKLRHVFVVILKYKYICTYV